MTLDVVEIRCGGKNYLIFELQLRSILDTKKDLKNVRVQYSRILKRMRDGLLGIIIPVVSHHTAKFVLCIHGTTRLAE